MFLCFLLFIVLVNCSFIDFYVSPFSFPPLWLASCVSRVSCLSPWSFSDHCFLCVLRFLHLVYLVSLSCFVFWIIAHSGQSFGLKLDSDPCLNLVGFDLWVVTRLFSWLQHMNYPLKALAFLIRLDTVILWCPVHREQRTGGVISETVFHVTTDSDNFVLRRIIVVSKVKGLYWMNTHCH